MENLEKNLWTDADFDKMGWHDCKIYAISFSDVEAFELALDIDYIFRWDKPSDKETNFKFLVAPATLVFKNVYEINFRLSSIEFTIDNVTRANPNRPRNSPHLGDVFEYDWSLETSDGELTFKSIGYSQFIRQKPIILETQSCDFDSRGGISFDRTSY